MKRKLLCSLLMCMVLVSGCSSNMGVDSTEGVSSSNMADADGNQYVPIKNSVKHVKTTAITEDTFDVNSGLYKTKDYNVQITGTKIDDGVLYISYDFTNKSVNSLVPHDTWGYEMGVQQGDELLTEVVGAEYRKLQAGLDALNTEVDVNDVASVCIAYKLSDTSTEDIKIFARDADVGSILDYYNVAFKTETAEPETQVERADLSGEAGGLVKDTKQYKDGQDE